MVLGADTGIGKTGLCMHIATHNRLAGKKVALLLLESHKSEFSNRLSYQYIQKLADKRGIKELQQYSFAQFQFNKIPFKYIAELEDEVATYLDHKLEDLVILKIGAQITPDNLKDELARISSGPDKMDLIIIDHIHDLARADASGQSNHSIDKVMATLKQHTQVFEVPIIAIAHFSKASANAIIGNNYSFKGSASIGQDARTTILIAPHLKGGKFFGQGVAPTVFSIGKNMAGFRSSKVFLKGFSLQHQRYNQGFITCEVRWDKDKKREVLEEVPTNGG